MLSKAWWTGWGGGMVCLEADCEGALPCFSLGDGGEVVEVKRADPWEFGAHGGCFIEGKDVYFTLSRGNFPELVGISGSGNEGDADAFYVAGNFNDWGAAVGKGEWRLMPKEVNGRQYLALRVPVENLLKFGDGVNFKFVSERYCWLNAPEGGANGVADGLGGRNFHLSFRRSGRHAFKFEVQSPVDIWAEQRLVLHRNDGITESLVIDYERFLLSLRSSKPLGAIVEGDQTTFRLFAPRAERVGVAVFKVAETESDRIELPLQRSEDGVWEGKYPKNLDGFRYYYTVTSACKGVDSHFDDRVKILDPYALATVSREGPGIILDSKKFQNFEQNDPFVSPALQDLVIMECHVRDLLNKVPDLADSERLGFVGLTRWLRSSSTCYLSNLGINAVELQPLQDFDSVSRDTYHWGYMPINYFCPARDYATQPEKVSQIVELQDCVKAFHERGIAVIVDVVYNHVGDPKPLLCIDKRYYFHCMPEGKLTNWSGCGNDLRTQSPMVRRLILDSLLYWVKTFHVDGFRFDLAELLGKELLCEIERELRKVRPGIILIAEPWSFRAHMGISLKDTEFSVWNDGYRDFVAQYVCEKGNSAGIQYFLGGSIKHLTRFPTQTINYTESHDDRCWIDKMTERSHNRGDAWTKLDRQRTHLMFSILFASLGIPMIAAGQDFLKSKHGVSNTYQNGALNALDYLQIFQCPSTHDYVKNWIAFRKSLIGGLLRLDKRPSDGYLTFFEVPGKSSIGALFNADHSLGPQQILYAVNPHHQAVSLHLPGINPANFTQIADHEHFSPTTPFPWTAGALHLPPVSCGLLTRVL